MATLFQRRQRKPLTAATGGTISSLSSAATTNYYFYQFQATQLLYDFGKTPGLIKESRASFGQSEQDYAGSRQQVALDARTAYFGYLAAQRALKVQEETVRQNQALLKQAQGFYQVGLKAKIDVTKAEANLYDAEASLIKAKNAVDLARVTLMTALGLKTWPFTQVEDVLEVKAQPQSLEALKAQGQQRRPELLKNRQQQNYNEAAIKVAQGRLFPRAHFQYGLRLAEPGSAFCQRPQHLVCGRGHDLPAVRGSVHGIFGQPDQSATAGLPWKITKCCARTSPKKWSRPTWMSSRVGS